MKKVLLGTAGIAGVAVGAIVIWKIVIPFIGNIMSLIF